ncbi:FliI/YscN family ATPase [Acidimangrovimonas sediminis]|uniref:FliI/YscN family ATPase n=1 Tax=Acidimangrovimonas sediminis TaxID=2056283 RepID=UPI000C7F882D|nr:flagellar protein export ATPase FliI [Acidimangrovimonas sediminis]
MNTIFSDLTGRLDRIGGARLTGRVQAVTGLTLTVVGLERALGIGARCEVIGAQGPVLAEVVGIGPDGTRVLPFGSWDGVSAGDRVVAAPRGDILRPDDSWIGRVVDALGRPAPGGAPLRQGADARPVRARPPSAFDRRRVGPKLATGIRVMDIFTPLCRGQRMGVFAGSGVGKSTLMAMLARNAEADVVVIGLVGERGREVQDFLQDDLGPEGLARSVVVAATGDEPPLMRRQAAWTALAVAEHFRDEGRQVLLLLDSVTRFAMAQREIGLAGGEPPTSKGYPPTVFAELPRLLERAGPGGGGAGGAARQTRAGQTRAGQTTAGDITALFTVLVDGDDMNEPVADAVRGILDGHIVLDRQIAERGRFPAVNLQQSVSRMLPDCHSNAEYRVYSASRRILGRFSDMEELIRLGAYQPGADPETDMAMRFEQPATVFLGQRKGEKTAPAEAFAKLERLLVEAGVPLAHLDGTDEGESMC